MRGKLGESGRVLLVETNLDSREFKIYDATVAKNVTQNCEFKLRVQVANSISFVILSVCLTFES